MMKMATEAELKTLAATRTDMTSLAGKVLSLQTADKFRLAALLLDQNKWQLAKTVGTRACQEIELAELLSGPTTSNAPKSSRS